MIKSNKGQIALEALIILGILIVGTMIFALFFLGQFGNQSKKVPAVSTITDGLMQDLGYDVPVKDPDDEEEDEVLCGNGFCDAGEATTCPQDCTTGTNISGLTFVLDPESPSLINTDFNIIVNLTSDYPSVNVTSILITKYDEVDYTFYPTNNCELNGDYSSEFTTAGQLLPSGMPNKLSNSFEFSCTTTGNYDFEFSVSTPDGSQSLTGDLVNSGFYPNGKIIEENNLAFISTWDTSKPSYSTNKTNNNQIMLPLVNSGTYNFTVNWGDGTTSQITSWDQTEKTHTYANPGIYTLTIIGDIWGFGFFNDWSSFGDANKLIEISQWGSLRLGDIGGLHFYNAGNLIITAQDVLDVSEITNMRSMFANCVSLTTVPRMNEWDVSNVTNMIGLFSNTHFNQYIGEWNTSNVIDMSWMFHNATSFNQPIGNWNVSNVTNMSGMFNSVYSFDQNIAGWDVQM